MHLVLMLGGFALLGYVLATVGVQTLWNPRVWWQSILVWFLVAVIAHDLVLFPLYALADRGLLGSLRVGRRVHRPRCRAVPAVNYVRVPALGSGLLLLVFFPGIVEQGGATYLAATGQTQDVFLARWLLISATMFGISAACYAIRVGVSRRTTHRKRNAQSEEPEL